MTAKGTAEGQRTAEKLRAHRQHIIERWAERVRHEIPAARHQERTALLDSLPVFIGELADWLASDQFEAEARLREKVLAKVHGVLRADVREYDLTHVLHEYDLLRDVLIEVLDEDGSLSRSSRQIVLEAVQLSIRHAAAEFVARRDQERQVAEKAERAAAAQIAEQKRFFDAMLSATTDHLYALDEAGRFIYVNRAAIEVLGRPREEVLGRTGRELGFSPDYLAHFEANHARALRGETVAQETLIRTFTGVRRFEYVFSPLRREDGAVEAIVGTSRDIHDRAQLIEKLNEERTLREQMAAAIAHDLRSPLAAAKLNADQLLRLAHKGEREHRLITRLLGTIERSTRMVQDLLDAARVQAGEPLPLHLDWCDLRSIIESTVEELSLSHGERFTLTVEGDLGGYWACEELRRVVENLAGNAVKYGDPNEPITITATALGDAIALRVHNTGQPIAPEDQERIFEPHRRTSEALRSGIRGWGIGLSLVRAIATAHGGTARVESDAWRGTTFIVTMPRRAPQGF